MLQSSQLCIDQEYRHRLGRIKAQHRRLLEDQGLTQRLNAKELKEKLYLEDREYRLLKESMLFRI